MVIGAEGSGAITAWSPHQLETAERGVAARRHVEADGPVLGGDGDVGRHDDGERLAGRGRWSGRTTPTMTIFVPAAPKVLATESAWVTVLKLQVGVATPAATPLPVAVPSSPLMGSTK